MMLIREVGTVRLRPGLDHIHASIDDGAFAALVTGCEPVGVSETGPEFSVLWAVHVQIPVECEERTLLAPSWQPWPVVVNEVTE